MKSWTSFGSILWLALHDYPVERSVLNDNGSWRPHLAGLQLMQSGTSLFATGATVIVSFLYVRTTDDLWYRLEIITQAGLSEIFSHRSYESNRIMTHG